MRVSMATDRRLHFFLDKKEIRHLGYPDYVHLTVFHDGRARIRPSAPGEKRWKITERSGFWVTGIGEVMHQQHDLMPFKAEAVDIEFLPNQEIAVDQPAAREPQLGYKAPKKKKAGPSDEPDELGRAVDTVNREVRKARKSGSDVSITVEDNHLSVSVLKTYGGQPGR